MAKYYPGKGRICLVEGCGRKHCAKGFCSIHYKRSREDLSKFHDPISDDPINQRYHRIYFENDYVVMIVVNRKGEETHVLMDLEDIDLAVDYVWSMNGKGYPVANIGPKPTTLHRYLLQLPKGVLGDHINGNTLDNRKCNLRACTHQENSYNRGINKNNKSGVTGVRWDKAAKKWAARITIEHSNKNLGYFDDFTEAVKARRAAEIKYFGEFRRVTADEYTECCK